MADRKEKFNAKTRRRIWLKDYFIKNPDISEEEVKEVFFNKYPDLSYSTLWVDFREVRNEVTQRKRNMMEIREKALEEIEMAEGVRSIKTKTQRLLEYQKLVTECFTDLSTGTTRDTYFDKSSGKPKNYRRPMTIAEYNQTRRTLKDIQVEISKIEGDYAPEKQNIDHTTKGDKLSGPVVWEFVDAKKK